MREADSEQLAHQLNARLLRFRSEPGSEDARALAEDLIAAQRYGDARGVAVSAQPDAGDDGELLVLEGRAWFLERDLVRAQATLLRAVRVDPARGSAYRWLGEVLLKRGDPLRATKILRRAIELDPSDPESASLAVRAEYLAEAAMAESQPPAVVAAPAPVPAPAPVAKPQIVVEPEPEPESEEELDLDDAPPEPVITGRAPAAAAAAPMFSPGAGRPSPFPAAPPIVSRPPAAAPPRPAPPPAPVVPSFAPRTAAPAAPPPRPSVAVPSAPPAPPAPRSAPGTLASPRTSPGTQTAPGTLASPRTSPGGVAAESARTSPGSTTAPGLQPAPRSSPGRISSPGQLDAPSAPRTSPGALSSPGTQSAPRTSPGTTTAPGLQPAPRSSPGRISSPGQLDAPIAPRTSPGTLSSPGQQPAPRTSPGSTTAPGLQPAPRTSPGRISSPGHLEAPLTLRTSPGTISSPGSTPAPVAASYEGLSTLSGDDDAPLDVPFDDDYALPPSAAAPQVFGRAVDDTRDLDTDAADVEMSVDDDAYDDDASETADEAEAAPYARAAAHEASASADAIEPGVPPQRAPDLALGRLAGHSAVELDAEQALEVVKRHGIFEEPASPLAQWSKQSDVAPSGTRLRNSLIGVWVFALALAAGGYYGWQAWIEQRHARAAQWVAQAQAAMEHGDHARLVDAERLLRLAHAQHPASGEVPRVLVELYAERVLEDGQRDLSELRAALGRAQKLGTEPATLAVANAIVSAYTPLSATRADDVKAAVQAAGNTPFLRYLVGRLEQRLGQPDAQPQLMAAVQGDPKLVPAQLALAELELDAGEREPALARLDAVLAAHADHVRAQLLRTFASANDVEPVGAMQKLDALAASVKRAGPGDQLMLALSRARLLRRQGKNEDASQALEVAGSLPVDEPRLAAWVAREALALGKLALAQRTASQALSAAPEVAAYRRLLARILIERDDGEHALLLLSKLGADDTDAQIMKAQAALIASDPTALRAGLEALTAVQTQAPEQKTQIGALRIRLQAQLEPSADLVAKARALVQAAPGDADALLALAEAALAAHDPATATTALTQRFALVPDDPNAYYLHGRARRMALDAPGAEASFRKALALAPGHADALSGLGALLLDMGKYSDADTVYEGLASRGASQLEGRLGRIDALLGMRRYDDAQVQLDAIPESQRTGAGYRTTAVQLALARNKPGDALTLLRPLVDAPVKKPVVLALYGDALHAAEQVDAAAGAYDAALEQDPEFPEALIGRAEVHLRAERPADSLSILETAQKALATRMRPPSLRARLLCAMGRSYIMRSRHGDVETARGLLREAVQLSGAAPETFFWLGEALGGKITPEAQAAYQRYLAFEPSGKYADRAKRALGPLLDVAPAVAP